jgi:hypothetical protein
MRRARHVLLASVFLVACGEETLSSQPSARLVFEPLYDKTEHLRVTIAAIPCGEFSLRGVTATVNGHPLVGSAGRSGLAGCVNPVLSSEVSAESLGLDRPSQLILSDPTATWTLEFGPLLVERPLQVESREPGFIERGERVAIGLSVPGVTFRDHYKGVVAFRTFENQEHDAWSVVPGPYSGQSTLYFTVPNDSALGAGVLHLPAIEGAVPVARCDGPRECLAFLPLFVEHLPVTIR